MSDKRLPNELLPTLVFKKREFLLEPSPSIRIERYVMQMGHISAGTVDPILEQTAQMTFRCDRIGARANIIVKIPWYLCWFQWFVFPWLFLYAFNIEKDSDVILRWRVRLIYPVRRLIDRKILREQQRMLASCQMVSLSTDDIEALAMPVPLHDFYIGVMPKIDLPTIPSGKKVICKFKGTAACDITVTVFGFVPTEL